MSRAFLFACASCAFLTGGPSASPGADPPPKPPAAMTRLVGADVGAILSGATRVEVFRISISPQHKGEKGVGGYAAVTQGKDKGKEFAADLANALFRLRKYQDDSNPNKGHLLPVVGLRLWKGKQYAEVIIAAGDQVGVLT